MILRRLRRLWRDERGAINSTDIVLITTILILGSIVGLVVLRNQVVQELGDIATAVGALNQSYEYIGDTQTITTGTGTSLMTVTVGTVTGSSYDDLPDVGDGADVDGEEPGGISVRGPLPLLRNTAYGENK
jgi:hypothetical protein